MSSAWLASSVVDGVDGRHGLGREVAPAVLPLIVLFGEDHPDQPDGARCEAGRDSSATPAGRHPGEINPAAAAPPELAPRKVWVAGDEHRQAFPGREDPGMTPAA